ncbi:hypothetical protein FDC62_11060 [Clostridium botulinum]|uniref:hypothetical protein n=1 Tax=Clostridium botulinum TaxID=1491 RepID=UPI00052CC664|nr:hypothetical protein [Clostridium botulinum]KGM93170.1 hypothetical protein Z956_12635 [Clostridium botulinum D str. CCUG 7971]KOC48472.1 hypothetical protein ADU88_07645 [Clostridium botulinum]NFO98724.1 hypothetical protein [Clostridium botulinum]OOV50631.1 hypothetical protein B1A66_13600 [Clostridium botulinum D/C]OOV55961.1 hypothetical protein B0673_07075 [Clostridium botulinum D/C]
MNNEKIEALITANEYLNNLELGIQQVVEAFQQEDENKGCSLIPLVADGIKWIMDVVSLTRDVQKEKIDISQIDDKLEEVVKAIENEDYILVGDLFEYEILPILQEIHNKVRSIVIN